MADRRPRSSWDILRFAGAAMAIPPIGSAAVTTDEDDPASVSLESAQSKPLSVGARVGSPKRSRLDRLRCGGQKRARPLPGQA